MMRAQEGVHAFSQQETAASLAANPARAARGSSRTAGVDRCLVDATHDLASYAPPAKIERQGGVPLTKPQVEYVFAENRSQWGARSETLSAHGLLPQEASLEDLVASVVRTQFEIQLEQALI